MTMKIRTRYAPSPTGKMHVGNLRTALYEYLIAKHEGGDFLFRIEDTDTERYVEGAIDIINNTMKMAGLEYDEGPGKDGGYGPYVQSERVKSGLYLEYAKKLVELDKTNIFPKASKDYRLGILYSQNGDYISSNNYLYPYINQNMWARFQMAQNYYYMQDLKNAENYAGKIPPNDSVYLAAQELLYSIYNITKNPQKAYTAAKILVKLDPGNPDNYMKVAYATTNNDEKLINLYRAKQIFYSQNLSSMIVKINDLTAPLEQKRIDEAYKKITSYCKKPDWFKVKSRNENLLSGDITYWDRRQSEFFETANDCIKRYSGSNLAACFKDLNDTQEHLDATLAAEQARREEAEQREIQIRQLVRQNMLLEEQNLIQWSRYNSFYPRYYRHPYWW